MKSCIPIGPELGANSLEHCRIFLTLGDNGWFWALSRPWIMASRKNPAAPLLPQSQLGLHWGDNSGNQATECKTVVLHSNLFIYYLNPSLLLGIFIITQVQYHYEIKWTCFIGHNSYIYHGLYNVMDVGALLVSGNW